MTCGLCDEGERWIKTCRTKDGSHIRVCDPCWEILSSWLVIVPGNGVVTARCEECGAYCNPRQMGKVSPGGRYNAYSGTCEACTQVSARRTSRRLWRRPPNDTTIREKDSEEGLRVHLPLTRLLV